MKKMMLTLLIIVLITGLIPLRGFGAGYNSVTEYLDAEITKMVQGKQVKGAVVSVVCEEKTAFCKGFGMADEKNRIRADCDYTAFRIGSISKTFVALAAEQLAEKGRLDMNTPVTGYLEKDFPDFKYRITMNNLLTHTAGFEDLLTGIPVYDSDKAEPLKVSIRKYKPSQVFIPGQVISYSNYGIALAAYVIERITGQDFYKYAEESIFKPLNMLHTSFRLENKGINISKAYTSSGKEAKEPYINLYPEGSAVSTAKDMTRYMLWLLSEEGDRILSNAGKTNLFAKHFTMSDEFEGIGHVWNRRIQNGFIYYEKKGETLNFFSRVIIYPGKKTGVFISFNTAVPEDRLDSLMEGISSILLGAEKKEKKFKGKQTADISGYYIPTRSNFKKVEKVMNFLTPGNALQISGNLNDGFRMNGKRLVPIGENYYRTSIGNLKIVERRGKTFLATDTAISYLKTAWYEKSSVQLFIALFYALTSVTIAVMSIIAVIGKRKKKTSYILAGIIVLQVALFIAMCVLIYEGIASFTLLTKASDINLTGIILTATGVLGICFTGYNWIRKEPFVRKILLTLWSLSSVLFYMWMVQVNIL